MELWIRSQDKTTLIKSYEMYIAEYDKGSYVIRAKRTSHILGAYNSFERALEVLDEIQDKLNVLVTNEVGAEFILARNLVPIIYEMPKD